MAYVYYFFLLHFHSSIQTVGRKTAWTGSNEARLYLFIFKSVCACDMSTSELDVMDFQMFTTKLTYSWMNKCIAVITSSCCEHLVSDCPHESFGDTKCVSGLGLGLLLPFQPKRLNFQSILHIRFHEWFPLKEVFTA